MQDSKKLVGYWYSKDQPQYPKPKPFDVPWHGQAKFIKQLRKCEAKATERPYKGYSKCRICNEDTGYSDFNYKNWMWPSGYLHYIEAHNVKPPQEFIKFVMGKTNPKPINNVAWTTNNLCLAFDTQGNIEVSYQSGPLSCYLKLTKLQVTSLKRWLNSQGKL